MPPLIYAKYFQNSAQLADNSSVSGSRASSAIESSLNMIYSRAEPEVWSFVADQTDVNRRADEFIAPRFPLLSRTKRRLLFASGAVTRNGLPVTAGYRLQEGDRIILRWALQSLPPVIPDPASIPVIWEDEHFAAIDKPSGMLMHPTRSIKRGTLTNALLHAWNPRLHESGLGAEPGDQVAWPRFVHRLDRDTSGVVIAAKSVAGATALAKCFASRSIRKCYLAILCGAMACEELRIRAPIARVREESPQWGVDESGAPAVSVFRALQYAGGRTLAALQPLTGRTNQLRIHAAWQGMPILGDVCYGADVAARLCLHAWTLDFVHPFSGEQVHVEAPAPPAIRDAWPKPMPQLSPGVAGH